MDIDGTLSDYHGHFVKFAAAYLHVKAPPISQQYNGVGKFRQWAVDQWGVDSRTWSDIKLAYRQGAQKRVQPIFPGAHALMEGLKEAEAEVWLTTTRPHLRLDGIDPDTRAWLDHHGIEFDYLLYDDEKYHQLSTRVESDRVVAVLDDLAVQYDAAEKTFGSHVPILRRNLWNRGVVRGNLATLPQAKQEILRRIGAWYDTRKPAERSS